MVNFALKKCIMKQIPVYLLLFLAISCSGEGEQADELNQNDAQDYTAPVLPYIGLHDVDYNNVNGEMVADTIYHTVPDFALTTQDGGLLTGDDVKGKIHVANFFFTHCPAICPAMIEQMKRLQENTSDIEELIFISHTIDPERDTLGRLREYITERNINTSNWFFLRGERDEVYPLGEDGYMINAMEDEYAEGGFLHSEHFVLVDREGHIRGLYVGTDPIEVDKLEADIRKLLKEQYGE